MDPRYDNLEFLYGTTENNLPGLEGFHRVTQIAQVKTEGQAGHVTDYKIVMVSVSGPGLAGGHVPHHHRGVTMSRKKMFGREAGFTLIELLIVTVVFGIVLTGALGFMTIQH